MRALFILILSAAYSMTAYAGCENSTLQIHTAQHLPIKVYVDGSTGSNPPTVGVTVTGITPGRHHLKVVEIYNDRYGERIRRTVYNGNVDVRPSMHMDARVDEGRGVAIHDTHVPCGEQYNAPPQGNDQRQGDNQQYYGNNDQPVATNTAPIAPPVAALPPHLSDGDFQQVVGTLSASPYETKRLDTLKTVIGTSQLSTDQVSQIMQLFSFESNKLEVAKMLYDHTVDKQNYSSLSANFNFDSNKEAFKKFLAGR